MKKKALEEAIHQIPYMMRGGAPLSDHRFHEFEIMIDNFLEEDDLGDETLRRENIEKGIAQAMYAKFPI